MNRAVHKFCAWSGLLFAVIMGLGFVLLAGFIPPRPPGQGAVEIAQFFITHRTRIRWGMILCMFGAPLLMTFAVSMAIHMRRIEGRFPALALTQLCLGVVNVVAFFLFVFLCQIATFRVGRAPELIQLLNDMAWIPFIGIGSPVMLELICFGAAILLDKRARPIFPRWLGYYNLWVAFILAAGAFNVFFQDGPLAWNGLIAFYIPLTVMGTWLVIDPIYLSKAVDTMVDDQRLLIDEKVDNDFSSTEVSQLRADVDGLLARLPG